VKAELFDDTIHPKKSKKKKWFLKIIYSLFFLFILVDFFLFFLATPILKSFLQQKVSEQTKGLFSVDFKRISMELGTRRLALEEFELIADTVVYNQLIKQNKTQAALYNISCSSVELWRIGVYSLIFKGRLFAKNLKLIRPVVELKKLPGNIQSKTESRDFVHEDLFPALEPYLSEIKINNVSLENGKFYLSLKKDSTKTTTHIGEISVNLYNFLLNKVEQKKLEKLFFSQELQIKVKDYKINLSDKIHYLYAEAINISTQNSKLLATNVGINTINQTNQYIGKLKNNYYKISAPQIEFKNFDIYNLYFNNDIEIGNIICTAPNIQLVNILKKKTEVTNELDKSLEIDLSKLIKGKLNSIKVDTFALKKGTLQFYYNSSLNLPIYKANSISLDLFNFQLDDYSNRIKTKVFYSDNINLLIDTFTAILPDKTHEIQANRIFISSKSRIIDAESISLRKKNIFDSITTSSSLKIDVPFLNISGTDFFEVYHNRIFNIEQLAIGKSNIDILLSKRTNTKKENVPEKNILSIITTHFLKQLNISNFVLNQSDFKIVNYENDSTPIVYQGKASFDLKNFSISNLILSNDNNRLFYSQDFNLKLYNYSQDLKDQIHVMQSQSLEVSSLDSIIELTGFSVKPKKEISNTKIFHSKNKVYEFSLIQAFVKKIDINKAYSDSIIEASSISIFGPSINVDNYTKPLIDKLNSTDSTSNAPYKTSQGSRKKILKNDETIHDFLANYIKKMNVQALTIEKADVNMSDIDSMGNRDLIMSGKVSAKLTNFHFDTQNEIENEQSSYSDNISFRLTDYFSKFANKKYQLKIKQASFSSRDSVFLASLVRIFPAEENDKSQQSNKTWTFYAPEIRTKQTRIEKIFDYNILDMGSLNIDNPAIVLYNNNQRITSSIKNSDDSIKKGIGFKKIKFDNIIIKNGVFGILKQELDSEKLKLNTKIDIHLQNIEFDSSVFINPSAFFANLNAQVNLSEIHYQLPDSLKFIDVKGIELNTSKQLINVDSLKYTNNAGFSNIKGKTVLKEIYIPESSFSDFRLDKMIINKELHSSKMCLSQPFVNIYALNKSNNDRQFKFGDLNLYEKIKKNLNAIYLKEINLDSASVSISKPGPLKIETNVFNEIYANISNFLVDSLNQNSTRIFNSDDISGGIKNYGLDFSDSLYHLHIKDMGFSTKANSFFAKSITMNPNFERDEYAKKRQKETNLSYVKSKGLTANGINFIDLIDKKQLKATNIDFFDIQFQSYKNKQYPSDSVIKVSLPLEYLFRSKNFIKIDTINIHDSYLGYEMLGANALEPGIMDFTRINAVIINLTNDIKSIANNEVTVMKASGYLLDKSLLNASLHFPLDSKYGEYVYGGSLDSIDMDELNPLLENLYFVSIKDGRVNNINFTITANEDYAVGKLRMDYKDLKIELISKKKSDSLVVENRGLFSMVANSIVRDSNPKRKFGTFKEGRIYFERNIYKPVFNYWSLAPLSGVKSTLGFKSKQFKERLKIEKGSKKFEKKYERKADRIDKKTRKNFEKQIQKELKDEDRNRKKEQKKGKKLNKIKPIPAAFMKNKISLHLALSA